MWRDNTLLRFLLPLWPAIDRLLRVIYHIKPLRPDGSSLICVELRRYNGNPITLDDGSEIGTGDKIVEIHMNSAWFRQRRRLSFKTSHLTWEVLHCFAQDLSLLAERIAKGMFDEVAALHASTLLHIGARRLGFQVEELPNTLLKKWTRFYLVGLMRIYHLQVEEDVKIAGKSLELKEIWLSKAELLRRYGTRYEQNPPLC